MSGIMQHQFSRVPQVDIPRSVFDRTHTYKTTFDSGNLVPFYVDEALPGDTFNFDSTLFARMASPLNVPIMDNLYLDTFFFAVPIRLIWDNFPKMMGERTNPNDSTDFVCPTLTSPAGTGWTVHSLSDYFGLPTGIPNISANSFWHRGYNLIYNEWFRDQNLIDSVTVRTGDSGDLNTDYNILKRTKRHDYFTSCLPWPQKGPGVELPLGTQAPIEYQPSSVTTVGPKLLISSSDAQPSSQTLYVTPSGYLGNNGGTAFKLDPNGTMYADLTNASSANINDLRQAFQVQRIYEKDARAGSRYTEIIRSHFGVISPDARLQRPEYLGGSSTPIHVNPVQQTSASGLTGSATPQGALTAYALGSDRAGFTKSFDEHCIIIGLCNVRSDLTYQQGIPRMFSRSSRFDFYLPTLAHLGEQAVLNKEIYAQGTADDNNVFGYQERWAEYRYGHSKITGKLRSTYSTPLDVWHLSQKFTSLPTLSKTFIEEAPPISRITAVDTEPEFILDTFNTLKCARCMPVYSVPGSIDRF